MPSWQSYMFRGLMWYLRGQMDSRLDSVEKLRALSSRGSEEPRVPHDVRREAIQANGVPCEWLIPDGAPDDGVLLYLHGGGGVMGLYNPHRVMVGRLARKARIRALMVDYRLSPEHPHPAGTEDCVAAYRWLLAQGIAPESVVIGGDSAGGHLTLETLLTARDAGDPMPAAGVCISPATDLARTGDSIRTNSKRDALLSPKFVQRMVEWYCPGKDPRDPSISPLYADLRSLPPLLIQAGDYEILRDDSIRFTRCAREAGVEVTLEIYPTMWHVWHILAPYLPEAQQALETVARFIRERIGITEAEPVA